MVDLFVQAPKHPVTHSFASTLRHLGAAGLFLVAIIDSSPLPTFGGPDILTAILAASRRDLWYEYAASATAGSVIGAYLTFRLARTAGAVYLDQKFKKSKVGKFLNLFKKWGTGTLVASTMIPLPSPTSMFFAAAGASDYPRTKFVVVVAISRAVRYFSIALIAALYGRHFLRIFRHPIQHWGWLLAFFVITATLIVGGILVSRRLEPVPAK
jgi:membrane protein YqaA with SNARE-associated domain